METSPLPVKGCKIQSMLVAYDLNCARGTCLITKTAHISYLVRQATGTDDMYSKSDPQMIL